MKIDIEPCSALHFQSVKKYIGEFELDDRELKAEEFLVAVHNNTLVGFGRVREFEGCSEMCSLGVIDSQRFKGVGKQLTASLIKKALKPLFLVCIIPVYFERFNFSIIATYPVELQQKLNYCTSDLPVEENYVVMKLAV